MIINYETATIKIASMQVKESATVKLTSPEQAYEAMKHTANLAQETFNIITLDAKNREIGKHIITIGTLTSSLVHPRDIFRAAIGDNAQSIILAHNHPSGNPTPSSQDIEVTKKLIEAGKIMGIPVLDHVIVGRDKGNEFLSLRESGLCNFSA